MKMAPSNSKQEHKLSLDDRLTHVQRAVAITEPTPRPTTRAKVVGGSWAVCRNPGVEKQTVKSVLVLWHGILKH